MSASVNRDMMMRNFRRSGLVMILVCGLAATTWAQVTGPVVVGVQDSNTGATVRRIGDATNAAIRVNLVASAPTIAIAGTVAVSNLPGTVSTNSGNADASTIRVVIATNQPAYTVTANAGTNLNTSALVLDASLTGRLPAGASPSTGESNTNTNLSRIGAYNYVFNGTTWDRWTGGVTQSGTWTTQINQGGNTATVSAGGALKVDGSAVTQPVSGTVTANIGTTNGLALDATVTGRLPAGASPANGESNTNTNLSRIGAFNYVFNGSTWDRWTGAVSGTVTANLGTLNGAALDASVTGLQVAQASTTSGQKGGLTLGAVTTGAPSYTNGQTSPLSLTTAGEVRVSVTSGSSGNGAASNTGAAVPAQADYTGINVAGNLRGQSGANPGAGTVFAAHVAIVDGSGNQVTAFGGSGGTASNIGSAVPAQGTYAGFNDGTNLQGARVFDLDSGAGTQYGLGVNLRKSASGGSSELIGQATMANSLPVAIASDQGTVPVSLSGNQAVNVAQINGVTPLMGNGTTGTGSQRVTIASDNTAFSVNAVQSGTWTMQPGNTANTTAWLVAGGKTNNNAAPGATNLGVLSALANAAAPTWTEGNLAALSVDLHGSQRITLLDSGGTTMTDTTAHAAKVMVVDSTGTTIAPTTLATHDGALTPASTTGGAFLVRASAAAPTGVSADDDAVLPWALRNGSLVTNLAAGGTLITATSTSLNVNCTGGCSGGTQYTQDGALTVATTVGTMAMGRASAAAPTNVSADDDAVLPWYLRSGAQVSQPSFAGVLATTGNGASGTGVQRVTIANDSTGIVALTTGSSQIGHLEANQSTNIAQINGVTPLMGNGASGTGAQRVTIANDSTGQIKLTDGTNTAVVAATSGGSLQVSCTSGCGGSGGTSLADEATFTQGTTAVTPMGGLFKTSYTTLTSGQAGVAQMTSNGGLYTNLDKVQGTNIDVNSGNKSAGTMRVVLATDQPQLSNALKVDLSAISVGSSLSVSQTAGANQGSTLQTAATANGNGASVSLLGYHSMVFTVNCSSCSGGTTVNFEVSEDNSNFVAREAHQLGTNTIATSTTASGITVWEVPATGAQNFRARISAYSAGTITVTQHSTTVGSSIPIVTNANVISVPSNQTTNLAQIAGTTTDTNSGNKSAGTIRVVLATDQPALTNKLLVTPDANSAVNVAQINGVTTLMGNGATGTGSQRVTIASDNSAVSGFGVGATGSAPPANADFIAGIGGGATGGLLTGVVVCDQQAFLDMTTATTTELVALTASQTIHVCHIRVRSNGATTFTFKRGTGSNCGTGTTSIDNAIELIAQDGYVAGVGVGEVLNGGASANALCVTNSAAVNLHVFVRYAKY